MKVYFPMLRPDRVPNDPRPWALQVLDVDARERFYTEEYGTFACHGDAASKAAELNVAQGLDAQQAFSLFEAAGKLVVKGVPDAT